MAVKPIPKLRRDADKWFSLYVRMRDTNSSGYGECVTCQTKIHYKSGHAGHFISRRFPGTRWDELNVNLQCVGCNTFRAGEQYKYSLALEDKYGKGAAKKLQVKSQEYFKVRRDYLEQVIGEAKDYIASNPKVE